MTVIRFVGKAGKLERAKAMLEAHRRGYTPLEISRQFGVTQRCVYVRLNALGVNFEEEEQADRLWSMPENDRRREVAIRAARGAREALKAFPHFSPMSTVFTGTNEIALTPVLLVQDGSC